jgi:hypothetical protein
VDLPQNQEEFGLLTTIRRSPDLIELIGDVRDKLRRDVRIFGHAHDTLYDE